jgi:hypothetical protein
MFSPGLALLAVFAIEATLLLKSVRNRCVTKGFYCNAARDYRPLSMIPLKTRECLSFGQLKSLR